MQSGTLRKGFWLKFNSRNETKLQRFVGKESFDKLQFARLRFTKDHGKEAQKLSTLFVDFDSHGKENASHNLNPLTALSIRRFLATLSI
ncbi:hypothetical protein LguiB_017888 [Lonicera macranthoides]